MSSNENATAGPLVSRPMGVYSVVEVERVKHRPLSIWRSGDAMRRQRSLFSPRESSIASGLRWQQDLVM